MEKPDQMFMEFKDQIVGSLDAYLVYHVTLCGSLISLHEMILNDELYSPECNLS